MARKSVLLWKMERKSDLQGKMELKSDMLGEMVESNNDKIKRVKADNLYYLMTNNYQLKFMMKYQLKEVGSVNHLHLIIAGSIASHLLFAQNITANPRQINQDKTAGLHTPHTTVSRIYIKI